MVKPAPKPHERPFFVRQIGLDYDGTSEKGAIKGFVNEDDAVADVADRNNRATKMGINARYEMITN